MPFNFCILLIPLINVRKLCLYKRVFYANANCHYRIYLFLQLVLRRQCCNFLLIWISPRFPEITLVRCKSRYKICGLIKSVSIISVSSSRCDVLNKRLMRNYSRTAACFCVNSNGWLGSITFHLQLRIRPPASNCLCVVKGGCLRLPVGDSPWMPLNVLPNGRTSKVPSADKVLCTAFSWRCPY